MTVESASYISQLDTTLPTAADLISEGDDHLRLTKTVLKTQFPNFGTTAIAASAAEVNYSVGVTSAIQTQLNTKAPTASPTFTGTATLPATTSIGTVSDAEIATLDGVTSSIQAQINAKGAIAGQTWSGTHAFPITTTIGPLTPVIQGYLSSATSDVQAQISTKGAIVGQAWTGGHDFTSAVATVATQAPGDNSSKAASTAFVAAAAFSSSLPGQGGNAGKFVTTDGTSAFWEYAAVSLPTEVKSSAFTAVNGGRYACDTSGGAFTATLPANPLAGWSCTFLDYAGNFAAANLTVARNGKNILGLGEDYLLNQKNGSRTFIYSDATKGWLVK